MPRQTPSASDYTSVVRSSAVANDVASKPAGTPGAARASAAAVRSGGGLASLGAIGSIVKQSVVAKAIAPPPVTAVVEVIIPAASLQPMSASTDAFVVSYNSSGRSLWSARIASTGTDVGYNIATDSSGNVFVTGQGGNNATITVYSSNGIAFGTTLTNGGLNDAFVVKYNNTGTVQWAAKISSPDIDTGFGIATDSDGNVYITGETQSQDGLSKSLTAYNSNGSPFATTITATTGYAFLIKYSSAGNVVWVTRVEGQGTGTDVVVSSAGNVFMSGTFYGATAKFFNSDGSQFARTLGLNGISDSFFVKYDSNGFVQWFTNIRSTSDSANAVEVDSSENLYCAGYLSGTAVILDRDGVRRLAQYDTAGGTGGQESVLVKYVDGYAQWSVGVWGGGNVDASVATDSSGNSYIVGRGASGATLTARNANMTTFATTLTTLGLSDGFIVKCNTSGFVQWVAKIGSTTADTVYNVALDSDGSAYVVGRSGSGGNVSAYNFDGTQFSKTITNLGNTDAFIVKYNTSGVVQWLAKIGGTGADVAYDVAVDKNGKIYVTGSFASPQLTFYDA